MSIREGGDEDVNPRKKEKDRGDRGSRRTLQ